MSVQPRYMGCMSAKDRYEITLNCPCGSAGTAHIVGNDHPYAPPEAYVEKIDGPFSLFANPKGNVASMDFKCATCGAVTK